MELVRMGSAQKTFKINKNMFENRNYLIFNMSEVDSIDFTNVLETSTETLRLSVDETKSFVKWEGETPSFVSDLTNTEGPYSHSQILEVLAEEAWTPTGQMEEYIMALSHSPKIVTDGLVLCLDAA